MQESQVQSLGREDTLEKEMTIHSVFLPGEFHGQRSLLGYHPYDYKESDMTEHTCNNTTRLGKNCFCIKYVKIKTFP